jgi:hypothetical protein
VVKPLLGLYTNQKLTHGFLDEPSTIKTLDNEIHNIWDLITFTKAQGPQTMIDTDNMILQLLVSDCMVKSKRYNVLSTFEEYVALTEVNRH